MPEYAAVTGANAVSVEDSARSRHRSSVGIAWWVLVATVATSLEVFGVTSMITGM